MSFQNREEFLNAAGLFEFAEMVVFVTIGAFFEVQADVLCSFSFVPVRLNKMTFLAWQFAVLAQTRTVQFLN